MQNKYLKLTDANTNWEGVLFNDAALQICSNCVNQQYESQLIAANRSFHLVAVDAADNAGVLVADISAAERAGIALTVVAVIVFVAVAGNADISVVNKARFVVAVVVVVSVVAAD